MGPKKTLKPPEENLDVIVLIDVSLQLKNALVESLAVTFAESGKVKCLSEKLDIPCSVQFLTKTYNADLEKQSTTEWRTEKHVLVFYSALEFTQVLRTNPRMNAKELLMEIVGFPPTSSDRINIFLLKSKGRSSSHDSDDKVLEAEMKRLVADKATEISTEALVMYKTDLNLNMLNDSGAIQRVVRTTKSMLELIQHRSNLSANTDEDVACGSWYPKKSGPPISVSKNKIGLHNLWQRYLMQTSKALNVEQAKVITSDPGFASIDRAMQSYKDVIHDEKKAVDLLSNKTVRPSGATMDTMNLGRSRPSVGPETSRKVFKVLTSLDANMKI